MAIGTISVAVVTVIMLVCILQETSGRESREGLVTSEQQDDTLYTESPTSKHLPRHIQHQQQQQQQQQQSPAVPTSQRLKNPFVCRVLMLDGVEYELTVEVGYSAKNQDVATNILIFVLSSTAG